MRKFRALIQTNKEPEDTNVLWYYKGKVLYFDGTWRPLNKVKPEEITVHIESLPNVSNLKDALDYLTYQSNNYKIVPTKNDLYKVYKNDGTHVYVIDESKHYIYSAEDNLWIEDTDYKTYPFYVLAPKVLIKEIDAQNGTISLDNTDWGEEHICLAYNNNANSVEELSILELSKVDNTWNIVNITRDSPSKGQYVYVVSTDRTAMYIPVIETEVKEFYTQTSLKYYKNYYNDNTPSVFSESFDIRESLITSISSIDSLFEWKEQTDNYQKVQDALIKKNEDYAKSLNEKIDAKVIEAGGVAFDLEPTENSQNAVFSGGVYNAINNKFVVMTEDEYNELALKNPETFYFILE